MIIIPKALTNYDSPKPPSVDNELKSATATLYAQLATRESVSRSELLRTMGAPAELGEQALSRLARLGLLASEPGDHDRLVPVAPATAYAQILMPAIRKIREEQARISDVSAELSELLPVYESSALKMNQESLLHRLGDLTSVRRTIKELSARATREVLVCHPGGPQPHHLLDEELREEGLGMLGRDVAVRTLFQYAAQFHQPTAELVSALVGAGGEVRLLDDLFPRLVVFDEQVAVIELVDNKQGAMVVRDENVVRVLVRSFRRVWDRASSFSPATHDRGEVLRASEEMKMAIVELLAEGYDDKVVARRLGISLRTLQRHLAEVLRRIGAKNRLHAGYLIRDLLASTTERRTAGPARTERHDPIPF